MQATVLTILALSTLGGAAAAQGTHLLDARVRDLLHEELSGELAKEHVIAITRHHRIQGSRGYRDSAQWVLGKLREFGFDEEQAWIESFPSDGRVQYQTWQSPSGWDIESAELRMVAPYDERIVGYPEIAMSVITYSNAGEVTAPLVFVGRGTSDDDYEGQDVAGKLVLATGYGGEVHRQAVVKRGAAAVVCYLDDDRAKEYPDMLAYTGMWPKTEELEQVTFGFNLTHRQGTKLRGLLEDGEEVVLSGRVSGIGLEPYFMDVVVATIEGSEWPDQELLFTAHLDHPKESANDNASGSAAILDIARALSRLIDTGRLEPPKRTLRFLWVPEFYGTMAYIDAHPEMKGPALGGKVLANVNMDMVGENTELLHCRLEITRPPSSVPSVLGDVMADMAAMVDEMEVRTPRGSLAAFNYRVTGFAPGSDHMCLIERKVPAVMMWHRPDYTHHTSEDTPDKVDPAQLERCELIAAGALWYLASLESERSMDLVWLAMSNGAARLGSAMRRAWALVDAAPDEELGEAWGEASKLIHQARWRESRAVVSAHVGRKGGFFHAGAAGASNLLLEGQAAVVLTELRSRVSARGYGKAQPPPTTEDARIPTRLTRGMLAFDLPERTLSHERASWYADNPGVLSGNARFELVNFIDGERTVHEIRDLLTMDFGSIDLAVVGRFLEDLVTAEVVEWK